MPCLTNTTVFSWAISWSISDSGPGLVISDAPVLYRLLGASSKTPLLLPAFSSRVLTLDCALQVRAFLHRLGAACAEVKAPWEGLNGSATPASSQTYRCRDYGNRNILQSLTAVCAHCNFIDMPHGADVQSDTHLSLAGTL